MRLAYIHGFASGPTAKKALFLKERFAPRGFDVFAPDLNVPAFSTLSLRAMIGVLDGLDATHGDGDGWCFVGSSLGGWLAARWAELHPERVRRLVLLCPAFDLAERWTALAPRGAIEHWKRTGWIEVDDARGEKARLHYGFYEEACEEPPRPRVPCPTVLIHGTRDARVPIEGSREYAAEHGDRCSLVEVDDVHDLHASVEVIDQVALEHFGVV
jgi:pimeloyl-ACP methyl ester carboxylesterase